MSTPPFTVTTPPSSVVHAAGLYFAPLNATSTTSGTASWVNGSTLFSGSPVFSESGYTVTAESLEDIAARLDELSVDHDLPELYTLAEELTKHFADRERLEDKINSLNRRVSQMEILRREDSRDLNYRSREEYERRMDEEMRMNLARTRYYTTPSSKIFGSVV